MINEKCSGAPLTQALFILSITQMSLTGHNVISYWVVSKAGLDTSQVFGGSYNQANKGTVVKTKTRITACH
jgi:hypothetical protein